MISPSNFILISKVYQMHEKPSHHRRSGQILMGYVEELVPDGSHYHAFAAEDMEAVEEDEW